MNEREWLQSLEDRNLERIEVRAVELRKGARVRLRPRVRGDILDTVLSGRIATVASIEQDYEGRVHLAVILEKDPGRDLGSIGQPGHRFFFSPVEVEPLAS